MTDIKPFSIEMWTDALRSGDYKQGKSFLHTKNEGGDHYCCLGVLCDLAMKAGVSVRVTVGYPEGTIISYDGAKGLPPKSVTDWSGLEVISTHLPSMNDSLDKDFNQIADYIETNQNRLFPND